MYKGARSAQLAFQITRSSRPRSSRPRSCFSINKQPNLSSARYRSFSIFRSYPTIIQQPRTCLDRSLVRPLSSPAVARASEPLPLCFSPSPVPMSPSTIPQTRTQPRVLPSRLATRNPSSSKATPAVSRTSNTWSRRL